MSEIDSLAQAMLEQAKRFLEKAKESGDAEGKAAFLNASLLLCFASFEAHVNAIVDDFSERQEFSTHERAVLLEKEVKLKDGAFELARAIKMYRLDDRIQFLCRRFSGSPLDTRAPWWGQFQTASKLRNGLTHPKENVVLNESMVSEALSAAVAGLGVIYQAVYKGKFPAEGRGLDSKLNF